MKVLKVIHGYPPRYSAGSEVYSQLLAQELANKYEVQVFTRQENSFIPDYFYKTELDATDSRILVHLINLPRTRFSDQYIHDQVDKIFENVLLDFKPDIVHFGHLNHLSTNLPKISFKYNIPNIFTLHDFWLMCPRGQFVQRNSLEPWELCDGQEDNKCANQCYSGKTSGNQFNIIRETNHWQQWIADRMFATKELIDVIDLFIAPSKFLMQKFIHEFKVPVNKIQYIDYGFNYGRLKDRVREKNLELTFGYIGTHIPQKGIDLLIKAFGKLNGRAKLRIWGFSREDTGALKALVEELPVIKQQQIEWMGGYDNAHIVRDVFNKVDVIVVPSIWGENSPLVIHEAQQVRVPVITANYGGMSEYVKHNVNGLLFKHRCSEDLKNKMQCLLDDPTIIEQLGKHGYLYSIDGSIPEISQHALEIEELYKSILESKGKTHVANPGPWRITFDTNPDHCNYKCIMCECFSPYSKTKEERISKGLSKRIMPIETIRKVLQEAKNSAVREIIPSTMGEPLLYKDFDQIINMCHEFNLKLNLTTNGSFPTKGVEKWAELLVPVLADMKISWNGATKETHEKIMIGSSWDKVNDNLKSFIRIRNEYAKVQGNNRCTITLQLTFLETNFEELEDILNMAIDLGIDRLKGHHLWAHFDEIGELSMRRSQESIIRWNDIVKRLYEIVNNKLLDNQKKIILENFEILKEDAVKDLAPGGPCPFLGKEAWINTEGEFSPCCAPDNLRKSLGNFGSIHSKSLQEIWESKQYQDLRKNYLSYSVCQGCNMRKQLVNSVSL